MSGLLDLDHEALGLKVPKGQAILIFSDTEIELTME